MLQAPIFSKFWLLNDVAVDLLEYVNQLDINKCIATSFRIQIQNTIYSM